MQKNNPKLILLLFSLLILSLSGFSKNSRGINPQTPTFTTESQLENNFQALLLTVTSDLAGRGIPLTGDLQFLADWQTMSGGLDFSHRLQPGDPGYQEMIDFQNNLQNYCGELETMISILKLSNGTGQEDIILQLAGAHGL